MRNAYKISVRKLEGKRPFARLRNRWEVNIIMDLSDIGCEDVDWIHVAQDRVQWWAFVNTVMNIRVPCKEGNFMVSCVDVRF
jgi:hypothetical protein